jgi:hypothetical protein
VCNDAKDRQPSRSTTLTRGRGWARDRWEARGEETDLDRKVNGRTYVGSLLATHREAGIHKTWGPMN